MSRLSRPAAVLGLFAVAIGLFLVARANHAAGVLMATFVLLALYWMVAG